MSYEVRVVDEFKKDIKKLLKKYRSIKTDILELIEKLEEDYTSGIYYTRLANERVYLLTIFAKTQKENIDVKSLKPIVKLIYVKGFDNNV